MLKNNNLSYISQNHSSVTILKHFVYRWHMNINAEFMLEPLSKILIMPLRGVFKEARTVTKLRTLGQLRHRSVATDVYIFHVFYLD